MTKTANSVISDLKENNYAPVYFLHGEESFFIDLISDYIEKNALDESARSFNQTILYGKDVEVHDILTQARRFPMMSDRQTVIVKEAQEIRDLNKEEAQGLLDDYINNPLTSTVLVFCHKHKSFDKRKKFAKTLSAKSVMVESKKLYDNQVPDWTKNFVRSKGHQIEDKAAFMITEFIGNNLERIANEINKILINFKDPAVITPQLVQKYVGINKDYNSFELQRAIAARNVLKANQIINYFGDNPRANPILPIIAVLFAFFSKLLVLHSCGDKSESSLASKLKVNPYFIREYQQASRNYPLNKIIANIHYLREADLHSKGVLSVNQPPKQLLKELVFRLMH